MDTKRYIPTGDLQGDTRAMPDKGCNTGVTDTYGADLNGSATNRRGSLGNAAKSDKMDECCAPVPKIGG